MSIIFLDKTDAARSFVSSRRAKKSNHRRPPSYHARPPSYHARPPSYHALPPSFEEEDDDSKVPRYIGYGAIGYGACGPWENAKWCRNMHPISLEKRLQ